jgi:hypothetical protein
MICDRCAPGHLVVEHVVLFWPIATGDALTANRRYRGIADMDRFSSRNDL